MKNKPQNNPQKKVTKIVLVDAFTLSTYCKLIQDGGVLHVHYCHMVLNKKLEQNLKNCLKFCFLLEKTNKISQFS